MAKLTGDQMLQIAGIAGPMLSGAFSGAAQAGQNQRSAAQAERARLDMNVQRLMAAMQNQQQTGQNLQLNRQGQRQTQAQMSPLGQEQAFLQKQRLMAAMLPEMAKFTVGGPTDPGVAAAYRPPTNMLQGLANPALQASYGDQMTAQSLADRRKLMAGINPGYEFSPLGGFGLDPSFDAGVNRASMTSGAELKAYEAAQASLANQQRTLAESQQNQTALTQPNAETKKVGGVRGFLGGALKMAAPLAALIPGIGPAASIGLGAAAGVVGGKLQGQSMRGALGSGVATGLGTLGGEALQSRAGGQGLNPFNNGRLPSPYEPQGPPLSGQGGPGPSFAMSGPYNATGDIRNQLGQPQSSFRQMPGTPQGGGGQRPPSPNMGRILGVQGLQPGPWRNQPAYQGPSAQAGPQIGANPQGRVPGRQPIDQRQALIDSVTANPLFIGFTGKPAGMGMVPGLALAGAATSGLLGAGAYPMPPASATAPRMAPRLLNAPPVRGNPGSPSQGRPFNMGPVAGPGQRLLPPLSQSSTQDQTAIQNVIRQLQQNGNHPEMQQINQGLLQQLQPYLQRVMSGR